MPLDPHAAPVAAIHRGAEIPAGAVFRFGGRALAVVKTFGADARAPVIVEELTNAVTLRGQFALWSHAAVARAFAAMPDPCAVPAPNRKNARRKQ